MNETTYSKAAEKLPSLQEALDIIADIKPIDPIRCVFCLEPKKDLAKVAKIKSDSGINCSLWGFPVQKSKIVPKNQIWFKHASGKIILWDYERDKFFELIPPESPFDLTKLTPRINEI